MDLSFREVFSPFSSTRSAALSAVSHLGSRLSFSVARYEHCVLGIVRMSCWAMRACGLGSTAVPSSGVLQSRYGLQVSRINAAAVWATITAFAFFLIVAGMVQEQASGHWFYEVFVRPAVCLPILSACLGSGLKSAVTPSDTSGPVPASVGLNFNPMHESLCRAFKGKLIISHSILQKSFRSGLRIASTVLRPDSILPSFRLWEAC